VKRTEDKEGSLSENEGSEGEKEKECDADKDQFESSKDMVDIEEISKHAQQYTKDKNKFKQSGPY
jgi:hypothetical protein